MMFDFRAKRLMRFRYWWHGQSAAYWLIVFQDGTRLPVPDESDQIMRDQKPKDPQTTDADRGCVDPENEIG